MLSAHAPRAVMAAGCIPAFVQILGSSTDVYVQYNATVCLNHLASSDRECGLAAIEAGGLAALRQLQLRADPAVRPAVEPAVHSLELCAAAAEAGAAEPRQPSLPSAASSGPSEGVDATREGPQAPARLAYSVAAAQPSEPRFVRTCAAEGCGRTSSLKRCAGCGAVRYCSLQCQRAHWRAHRRACRQAG
ncbi:hypothetical protein ABPG77_010344 [Micractinium sp. CCAP 211/92]